MVKCPLALQAAPAVAYSNKCDILRLSGFNPYSSCGGRLLLYRIGRTKLATVFGVDGPGTAKIHGRPSEDLRLVDSDGLLLLRAIERLHSQH